jgi:type IV secretion system protein VirB4
MPTVPTQATSPARDQLDQAAARSTIASPHGGASHAGAKGYVDGEFSNGTDARLNALNQAHMTTGRYFRNTHSLSIAYTPETVWPSSLRRSAIT